MKIDEYKFGKTEHISFKRWIMEKYKTKDEKKRFEHELVQVRIAHVISKLRQNEKRSQPDPDY